MLVDSAGFAPAAFSYFDEAFGKGFLRTKRAAAALRALLINKLSLLFMLFICLLYNNYCAYMSKDNTRAYSRIFERVIGEIRPGPDEAGATVQSINMLMARLKKIVPPDVELRVAGSVARGTNLKGNADIDIFMLFNPSYSREDVTRKGLLYGKRIVDKSAGESFEVKYAEHAYTRLYMKNIGLKADLVPAYKISNAEELATSVDRTPLHTEFINSRMSSRQKDHVRLLKFLLRNHGIYGAEVKVGGFSGYLCELLILQFGDFPAVLKAFSEAKLPLVLEPGSGKISNDQSVSKKFNSRFVVIDPVDPDRNVAAGVSEESLARLVLIARQFIENPDVKLIYGTGFDAEKVRGYMADFLNRTGTELYLIAAKVPDKSEDVIWPQLRKVSVMITEYLRRFGVEVWIATSWKQGKTGLIMFVVQKKSVKARILKGPDIFMGKACGQFIKKHRKAEGFIIRDTVLYAIEKNKPGDHLSIFREVASGRPVNRHKEISLKGSRLYVNSVPKQYAENAYIELEKEISI